MTLLWAGIFSLVLPLLSPAFAEDELLPAEKAFVFDADLNNEETLKIQWKIADGYYMYRDKMSFTLNGQTLNSDELDFPSGEVKEDELFGNVEVYVGTFQVSLPVTFDSGKDLVFIANGQGCNEPVGVCYPPMEHTKTFAAPVLIEAAVTNSTEANEEIQTARGPSDPTETPENATASHLSSAGESGSTPEEVDDPALITTTALLEQSEKPSIDPIQEENQANEPVIQLAQLDDSAVLDSGPQDTPSTDFASSESKPAINEVDNVQDLRNLLSAGFQQPEFLDVDEAFKAHADSNLDASGMANVILSFDIEDGYYLYRDKIIFPDDNSARVLEANIPQGIIKQDEFFGEVYVFKKDFQINLKLDITQNPILSLGYQGCAEDGICYSPVSKRFDLSHLSTLKTPDNTLLSPSTNNALSTSAPENNQSARPAQVAETTALDPQTLKPEAPPPAQERKNTQGNATLTLFLGAFVAGLLLTFTPCVLPMIPILSSFIVGHGKNLTKMKGGILSIFYVLGTAVTYAAMGALAGATGDQLQAYFQNAWAIGILSGLFVLMSLGMFGVFELQVPASIQAKIQNSSNNLRGSIPLVFMLGLISALIVGACVSPVLISTLSLAVSQSDPVLGAQIMFVMALGMGVPLIALGFGAGYLVPKAGNWMNSVKHVFGILLIGVAIYLLESIPTAPTLFLWGAFFVILSVYLGSSSPDSNTQNGWEKLERGIGIILLVWGILCLVGSFMGQRDVFSPIPKSLYSGSSQMATAAQKDHVAFQQLDNEMELDQALARAKTENKFVLIDYYADWCVDCIRMEETTFSDPQVVDALASRFLALQVDVTDPKDLDRKQLKTRFNVFGPPAVLFLDQNGNELENAHFYGYKSSPEFLSILSEL